MTRLYHQDTVRAMRVAATSSQADEWALVLTAAGIPNEVHATSEGWIVFAPADDEARAQAALAAYDDERRAPAPAADVTYPWMTGVAAALVLVWLFTVTATRTDAGAAATARIRAGELWRVVTALTMHVDVVHVSWNAVALAVLLPPLVVRFGAGIALLLLLAAGAAGNALSTIVHDPRHVAVGASTAIFGAVGALALVRMLDPDPSPRAKRWTAPVAGVVLLVLLGASREADLAAHAFGFVSGAVLGALAARTVRERPSPLAQWVVGGISAAIVAACWAAALRS